MPPELTCCSVRLVMQPQFVRYMLTLRCLSATKSFHYSRASSIQCIAHEHPNPTLPLRYRAFHATSVRKAGQTQIDAVKNLSQKALDKEEASIEDSIAQEKDKQQRAPWHREGSNVPPVARPRSAGAMTKGAARLMIQCFTMADKHLGKLLTTPSRLLKLIIPLTTTDKNTDRKDVEPLALLGQLPTLKQTLLFLNFRQSIRNSHYLI